MMWIAEIDYLPERNDDNPLCTRVSEANTRAGNAAEKAFEYPSGQIIMTVSPNETQKVSLMSFTYTLCPNQHVIIPKS